MSRSIANGATVAWCGGGGAVSGMHMKEVFIPLAIVISHLRRAALTIGELRIPVAKRHL